MATERGHDSADGLPEAPPDTLSSADYARRYGAPWRPTHAAATIHWPEPKTHPGGPGAPATVRFGRLLHGRIPELGVLEIEGARLLQPGGWVVAAEGLLLRDHILLADHLDAPPFRHAWTAARQVAQTRLPGTTLSLLSDMAWGNYCHFLLDALGRVSLVEAAGIDPAGFDRILVPKPSSENARRLLDAVGLPSGKLVVCDGRRVEVLRPDRLVIPTYPGAPGCYVEAVPRFLRSLAPRPDGVAAPATRLYVDRIGGQRTLENRAEILDLMDAHGFRIYDPSSHPDQPADFAGASVVVGAHGAGLANIAFCRPGTRVLEFGTTAPFRPFFFTLAHAAGLEHAVLPCRVTVGERSPGRLGFPPSSFRVDPASLRAALADTLRDAPPPERA